MNDQVLHLKQTSVNSLILCAALIGIFQSHEVHAAERPNILFVFADDWGRYASAYGAAEPHSLNAIVKTPNFDRVATNGVLFTHAFVNSPSCTPCRSSLLSGQYFWRTGRGAILQGAVWDSSIPAFPLLLQESGYRIGHSAKVWSPGTPANAPIGAVKTAFNKHGNQFNKFSQHVFSAEDPDRTQQELLDASTFAAFGDMDASPTKTWLLTEGLTDPRYQRFIDMQFALRPEEELYDLKNDPDQIQNVARQPEFATIRKKLSDRLLTILRNSGDPRVTGDGATFDSSPYSDPAK